MVAFIVNGVEELTNRSIAQWYTGTVGLWGCECVCMCVCVCVCVSVYVWVSVCVSKHIDIRKTNLEAITKARISIDIHTARNDKYKKHTMYLLWEIPWECTLIILFHVGGIKLEVREKRKWWPTHSQSIHNPQQGNQWKATSVVQLVGLLRSWSFDTKISINTDSTTSLNKKKMILKL